MLYTRRELGKLALTALPAAGMLLKSDATYAGVQTAKPNSKWAGVQVGMNVPYNFGNNNMSGDEVLARCLQLGISGVELRSQPVELFLGSPAMITGAPKPSAAELRKWRVSVPMSKVQEFRKTYEDAGVAIEIVKYDGILGFTDDVLDYSFELARTLGASAISCELPPAQVTEAKRLGVFADKHQMMIGFHGHTLMTPALWEQAFTYAKFNGANLDLGHFVGGNKTSPVPFLKQHHDRITHIHVKDKTLKDVNVEFGTGDTPIKEALQVIRDNKWKIQATIEFEIPGPAGADGRPRQWTMDERMAEMARCVQYCKDCLLG